MPHDLTAIQQFLSSRGFKLTRPRRLVAEKLLSEKGHVSADDLIERLRKDRTPVSKATVYRILSLLQESGLFDGHDFGNGRRLYEPMMGRPHHDHLFCIRCGIVIEFEEERIERLQEDIVRQHRFTPVYHSHKIFGYCHSCASLHAPDGDKGAPGV